MVERLCVPLIHSTVERHLNFAASGASFSAACAPNSASTLTPLSTGLSACVFAMASSSQGSGGEEFSPPKTARAKRVALKLRVQARLPERAEQLDLRAAVHDHLQPRRLGQPGRLVVANAEL